MLTVDELLREVERLPANDKWRIVSHVLRSLEQAQVAPPTESDWKQFLG